MENDRALPAAVKHQPEDAEATVQRIRSLVEKSGINENEFYRTFRAGCLPPETLKKVFQQYYFYIRTFPQILAGTSHRVDNEFVRFKLARTVVSELGDGTGDPHFVMFERVLRSVGVVLDDWTAVTYEPEAEALVAGLRRIFLERTTEQAIGAHFVIEEFGFPMIVNLYEGFRQYSGWVHEDFNYFYLHLLIESDHVDWVVDAALECGQSAQGRQDLETGATDVLRLLSAFWKGLDRIARTS